MGSRPLPRAIRFFDEEGKSELQEVWIDDGWGGFSGFERPNPRSLKAVMVNPLFVRTQIA
jgi:hypothetical protein